MPKRSVLYLLNIARINKNTVVDFSGNEAQVFQLNCPNLCLRSLDAQRHLLRSVEQFFNSMTETDITLTFHYKQTQATSYNIIKSWEENQQNQIRKDILRDSREGFHKLVKNQSLRQREFYLFIESKQTPINETTKLIKSVFSQHQIVMTALYESELYSLLFEMINGSQRMNLRPNYDQRNKQNIRSLLLQTSFREDAHSVHCGESVVKSLSLNLLPVDTINLGFSDRLLNRFKFPYSLTIRVEKPNQENIRKRLDFREGLLSITGARSKLIVDHHDALEQMQDRNQSGLSVSISVILRATTAEQVSQQAQEFIRQMKLYYDTQFISDDFQQLESFFAQLPHHDNLQQRHHYVLGSNIPYFLPIHGYYMGVASPDFYLRTIENDVIPMNIIQNDLPAPHGLVIGATGAGKSFLTNWLIKNTLAKQKAPLNIAIIDLGGSYEKICRLFGGTYYRIKLSKQYPLTIFPKKSQVFENNAIAPDQLNVITQLICMLITDEDSPKLTNRQEHLIQRAVITLYETISDELLPKLSEFQQCCRTLEIEDMDDSDRAFLSDVYKALSIYTDPKLPYYDMFNSDTQISLDNPFVVFDLTELDSTPRLKGVILQVIANLVRLRMLGAEKTGVRQLIIRDECWKFLKDDRHGEIIEEEYRTARKYGSVLLSVSQTVQDFLKGSYAQAIRLSSYVKYVLPIGDEARYLENFDLNDNQQAECQKLRHIKGRYNQVFVKFGHDSFVIHLEPTPLEIELCSKDLNNTQAYGSLDNLTPEELFDVLKQNATEQERADNETTA